MGHPKQLLENCVKELVKDYPRREYTYEFEKGVPGTRTIPDIKVLKGEELVCVVEIGYTRAEKIQIYRDQGIKDIRWYSKKMQLILHEKDLEHLKKENRDQAIQEAFKDERGRYGEIVHALAQRREFLLTFYEDCDLCDEEDRENLEGGSNLVFFTRSRYEIIYECGNEIREHDYQEGYGWSDENGPYYGGFEEFFEKYVEMVLKSNPNFDPMEELSRQAESLRDAVEFED